MQFIIISCVEEVQTRLKKPGADGIFQIQVTDNSGKLIRQKGLLFQTKKEWAEKDSLLCKQAKRLAEKPGVAIIIDFGPEHYTTCPSEMAAQALRN